MSSPYTWTLAALVSLLICPSGLMADTAAEAMSSDTAEEVSGLLREYREISKVTERNSPEFRAAIEAALAKSRERGIPDRYEFTLCRVLAQSYRVAHEYSKSSQILTEILGTGESPDANANDLLVLAQNARDTEDTSRARKFLEDAVKKYPQTSAGKTALAELERPVYGWRESQANSGENRSWRGLVVGANLVVIAALIAILIRRQVKKAVD